MKEEKEKMFRTLTKKEVRKLKGGYFIPPPDTTEMEPKSLIEQFIDSMREGWICR